MFLLISLRKVFVCVICFGGVLFCVIYFIPLHRSWYWPLKAKVLQVQNITKDIIAESPVLQTKQKPWFLFGGKAYPSQLKPKLFPYEDDGDRILDQLMYVPANYKRDNTYKKIILVYNSKSLIENSEAFAQCPVDNCLITHDANKASDADAIILKNDFVISVANKPAKQIWIIYHLECPYHTERVHKDLISAINWTATYRKDSDIVLPYGKWYYYNPEVRQIKQNQNYAANKTKKVAWFVSNCNAKNNRLEFAQELSKYISVDIYGGCGNLECPRSDNRCFTMLKRKYKFYLAFENSNCRDYITEKFYFNGMEHNVLPIVMGAHPGDYKRSAPEGSYIHVDGFNGPRELAAYLHRLDEDDELYNSYFRWKGTGEFINTYFWCRLCALLHAPLLPRHYQNINEWWEGSGFCTKKSWRN